MGFEALRRFNSLMRGGKDAKAPAAPPPGSGVLPIAVDFGSGALKVLQVAAGDPPSLIAAAAVETPLELVGDPVKRLKFQVEALPRLLKSGGFKGKRAVCAIPAAQMFCKQLQVPRIEGVPTSELVAAAIPGQFGCDPQSLVYRTLEIGSGAGNKQDILVMGVQRDVVNNLMSTIAGCKLQPVGMHSEFIATLRAFDYVHRREGDENLTTLYLDVGASVTNVSISHGRELVFARVINIGGRHLDEYVSEQLACTIAQARALRVRQATEPPPPVKQAAPKAVLAAVAGIFLNRRNLIVLLMAIELMLLAVNLNFVAFSHYLGDMDRAVFVGGEARHRGLCQHIARALRVSAQMADPIARVGRGGTEPAVGVDLKQAQPGWAVALGLCLSPTDL